MQRSLSTRRLANISSLLMCGVLAGIVVAAAAFPLVGSVGLSAKAASDSFEDLPSDLRTGPPPLTSSLYAADGSRITSFYEENRLDVPLAAMAKTMQDAIIAAEDNRFWQHKGTDPKGIMRAVVSNLVSSGARSQGGSTLTQQYVKQALYYSATTKAEREAAIAPNGGRKLREVRYAVALEQKLSKQQILERYLNIANFGNNTYGVAAASWSYFNRAPAKLTIGQAALLASIVKNPDKYEPIHGDKERAKQRRNYVIQRMLELKMIDSKQADAAKKEPIPAKRKPTPRKCENGNIKYGFFCGWFLDWWRANPAVGKTPDEREANLYKGGFRITTSLDPKMQDAAQAAVESQLDDTDELANGIVVIEPGTGRVKAMAVNRKYGLKKPATTAPLLSGNSKVHGYQAGSTFKMFTMVAALEKGMPLSHHIQAPQVYRSKYHGDGKCSPRFCAQNAGSSMTGSHTMWSAFGESVNTYFVQLEEQVGVKAAVAVAEKMGVKLRAPEDQGQKTQALTDDRAWGAFTLGVAQVTPLDMANAYATVAARGIHCDPLPLLKVLDHQGKPLPYANPTCKRVLRPEVADAAADAARCPVGQNAAGSCTHPGGHVTIDRVGNIGRPIAGKSGTTGGAGRNTPTCWFVGFTPNIAGAAFIANPAKPSTADLSPDTQRKAGSVFIKTMAGEDGVLSLLKPMDFTPPSDAMTHGVEETVPDVSGESKGQAKRDLERSGFSWQIADQKEGSQYQEGHVARTDPAGGSPLSRGSTVTIYLSSGENGFNGQSDPSQSPGNGGGDRGPGGGGPGTTPPIVPGGPPGRR